jgi:RNA polymerase-binding transcription factor DksA
MREQLAMTRLEAERQRLLGLRQGLHNDGVGASDADSVAELSAIDQHQADVGSEVFEHEKGMSILVGVEEELREVAAAMIRVERGEYGRCQTCGIAVPEERLEAVPSTRFCVEHEVLWEGQLITAPLPEGSYTDDAALPDSISAREAGDNLEYLPNDDELDEDDDDDMGPEERALHVTEPSGATHDLNAHDVELAHER